MSAAMPLLAPGAPGSDLPPSLQQRIAVVDDGCWLWLGGRTNKTDMAYGAADGTTAHRVVYELLRGRIPKGRELDHLCRMRLCVNPAHLEPVTRKENLRRGLNGVLKTHCRQGHELVGTNVARLKSGRRKGERYCRLCANASAMRVYYRRKERGQ